jgi:hypothetical protein
MLGLTVGGYLGTSLVTRRPASVRAMLFMALLLHLGLLFYVGANTEIFSVVA